MSVARAYSGAEGFIAPADRSERRQQRFIDRITGRVEAALDDTQTSYEVRGGFFGVSLTTHDTQVYEGVAERLQERESPAEIEVYRMRGRQSMPNMDGTTMLGGVELPYGYDLVILRSVGGVAVQQEHPQGDDVVARIYPPENH